MCMYEAIMHNRERVHYRTYTLSHLHVFRLSFKLNIGFVHYVINIEHPRILIRFFAAHLYIVLFDMICLESGTSSSNI